jgi:hypothetical protein
MADLGFLVTVSQLDESDGEPRPIFASRDPELIAALADHLARRLGGRPVSRSSVAPRPLRPVSDREEPER